MNTIRLDVAKKATKTKNYRESSPPGRKETFREQLRRTGESKDVQAQEAYPLLRLFEAGWLAGILEPPPIEPEDGRGGCCELNLDRIVERIVRSVGVVNSSGDQPRVQLEISTPQLRGVRLELELSSVGKKVSARFQVHDQNAYELLLNGSASLRAELGDRGVEVESIDVRWKAATGGQDRRQQQPREGFQADPTTTSSSNGSPRRTDDLFLRRRL